MLIEKIFKPEIANSGGYKGGKAISKDAESEQRIFKLSSNENILGSSPSAVRYVKSEADNFNIYPAGTPQPLYEALVSHYDDHLSVDQFIAGNGGSDLLQLITTAFLDRDTECIISNPCFAPYQMFSSWTGAKVVDVPLNNPDYSLDVSGILRAINQKTRLIFLTSPNNPTGTYIKSHEIEALLSGIPNHVVIIYDEVYHHFVEAQDYSIALPYVQKGHPIIAINSFSKAYGLASLRIGYGYSTTKIASYIRKLIRPFLISTISMDAAIAALNDQDFIKHTVDTISIERKSLSAGLKKLGVRHWPSQANFILIQSPIDIIKLTDLLFEKGIMVRPCANFGAPDCVRITVGDSVSTQATLEALATIEGK